MIISNELNKLRLSPLERILRDVENNVMHAFKALGIIIGTDEQSLDDAIQSKNNLAVKAIILKGNYQFTDNSLNLAIKTRNPDIVESIIKTGVEINSTHVIDSLNELLVIAVDQNENQDKKNITKNLVNAMRIKGQKIGPEVLTDAIINDNLQGIRLLMELNVSVKEEHIQLSEQPGNQYMPQLIASILKAAQEKEADAEKIKNLWVLGSGLRTKTGFFANQASEVVMKIVSLTGNESKPVTTEEEERYYKNKPCLH
jgi:hypothetical protein